MKTKTWFVVFLLILRMGSAPCQSLKPANEEQQKNILAQIKNVSAKTTSLECRFIQKKNLSVLSETITSEGIMYFKRTNSLRWQYDKPYSYIFILNGNKVLIKSGSRSDKFDTNSNKMFREISEIMIGGVNGDMLVNNKKFKIQFFVDGAKVIVKLIPRNKELKQLMQEINLTFNNTDWQVHSIEMVEQGGDNTIITFTERNVNKKISDDLFIVN